MQQKIRQILVDFHLLFLIMCCLVLSRGLHPIFPIQCIAGTVFVFHLPYAFHYVLLKNTHTSTDAQGLIYYHKRPNHILQPASVYFCSFNI